MAERGLKFRMCGSEGASTQTSGSRPILPFDSQNNFDTTDALLSSKTVSTHPGPCPVSVREMPTPKLPQFVRLSRSSANDGHHTADHSKP